MNSKEWARRFVYLYDNGAMPDEYKLQLGLSFEELCVESKRVQHYRNIVGENIPEYMPASNDEILFSKSFVSFVDKGAGFRAYAKLGIKSKEQLQKHMQNLSRYREIANGNIVPQQLVFQAHSSKFEFVCGKKPEKTGHIASIIVIGTTIPSRVSNLENVLKNIDSNITEVFGPKILSIDDFGEGIDASIVEYGTSNNWVIIIAKRRGMVKSQRDALSLVTTPWVLYSEDDAIVEKLPNYADMVQIEEAENSGKKVGVLSFMAGGYNIEAFREQIAWEIRKESSFIKINDEDVLWKRNSEFKNNWFIEFPISMFRTDILKQCSDYISSRNNTFQIEHGFTVAWFDMGFDREYFKVTYMKNPASVKPLLDYSTHDITTIYIGAPLIHMRLLNSHTINGGHNWGEKFNDH